MNQRKQSRIRNTIGNNSFMVSFVLPLMLLPLVQLRNQKYEYFPMVQLMCWCCDNNKDSDQRSLDGASVMLIVIQNSVSVCERLSINIRAYSRDNMSDSKRFDYSGFCGSFFFFSFFSCKRKIFYLLLAVHIGDAWYSPRAKGRKYMQQRQN